MVPIKPTHKLLGQNVFLLLKIVCTEALTIYETFKCDKNALSKFYIKVQSKYKLWTKIIFPLPRMEWGYRRQLNMEQTRLNAEGLAVIDKQAVIAKFY